MDTADSFVNFANGPFEHDHTPRAVRGHGFDTGLLDCCHLILGNLFGYLRMAEKGVGPTKAAAPV